MWRNTDSGWGWVNITIHWLTVLSVVGLFALGLWMVELTYYEEGYNFAPTIHQSVGLLLFVLTLFRVIWRWQNVTPQPLSTHRQFEKKIASLAHKLIYVLLFLILISGYLISTADGRSISLFELFDVPATLYGIEQQEDVAGELHLILSISLMLLVVMHAAGALKHHFMDKDATLKRMLNANIINRREQ